MPYVRKDPALVRLARQAAAAKSAEVRRRKAVENGNEKLKDISIKIYADDAEELAQMAAKVHKSRIQFIRDVVRYVREQMQMKARPEEEEQ